MAEADSSLQDAWRRWRHLLVPLLAASLPVLLLVLAGVIWLVERDFFLAWLLLLAIGGYLSMRLLPRANRRFETELPKQAADPVWPPVAQEAWAQVAARADGIGIDDWPESAVGFYDIAREVLEDVARHAHPDSVQPLAEVALPHALLVIECACHEMRSEVLGVVPFAHKVRLADLGRIQSIGTLVGRLNDLYRAGRLIAFPVQAIAAEAASAARSQAVGVAREGLQVWLLRQWIRKVGYHAIALYSGQTLLSAPAAAPLPGSAADLRDALEQAADAEPLRLLVLGRSSAGKSSLINALFGEQLAATDVQADTTTGLTPYVLERDGWPAALVHDSGGCDSAGFGVRDVLKAAERSDALLFVTAANRADRATERALLDALRQGEQARERGLPPLLVVVSHIDRLPPAREWSPPYDLRSSQPKAQAIAGAVESVARDLAVPVAQVIPVCLAGGHVYNVEDTLLATLAAQMDDLRQARLRRCLAEHRRRENWTQVGEQVRAAGRLLRDFLGGHNS